MTFIVILNWNGKADTLGCLKSLAAVTTPHRVVVVDNGSHDDSVEAIREGFPEVKVIETGENLGYAEGNNVGIRFALKEGAEDILILNNDTVVAPDILEKFLEMRKELPEAAIMGAKTYLQKERDRLDHVGGNWNVKKGTFDLVGAGMKDGEKWQKPFKVDYVCGCALFAKANVFREVGGFEPRFFLFWEESDWCLRAKKKGYESYFCPEAKLWHKVSASFRGGKVHTTYFWWRNRLFWIERNCKKREKLSLFFRVLLPEVGHLLKLYLLKGLQLKVLMRFKSSADYGRRKKQLREYRAALCGIRDYLFRRFGNGPTWIFNSQY